METLEQYLSGEIWIIDKNGKAVFNDVTVRGTISAVTFEHNKVQTLGGAILLRPSFTVKEAIKEEKEKTILYVCFKDIETNEIKEYYISEKEMIKIKDKIGSFIEGYGVLTDI